MFRGRAERKVIDAGYDPARLPPGQYLTEKWPVLHAGSIPRTDLATWDFLVWGEVEDPIRLSWDELNALPRTTRYPGHPLRHALEPLRRHVRRRPLAALELARPKPPSRALRVAHAEEGYTANVPSSFLAPTVSLLATHADGEPLTPSTAAHCASSCPAKYFWKSAKWLRGIELTANDRPGFWERYGYHNDADPFKEERYAF